MIHRHKRSQLVEKTEHIINANLELQLDKNYLNKYFEDWAVKKVIEKIRLRDKKKLKEVNKICCIRGITYTKIVNR